MSCDVLFSVVQAISEEDGHDHRYFISRRKGCLDRDVANRDSAVAARPVLWVFEASNAKWVVEVQALTVLANKLGDR